MRASCVWGAEIYRPLGCRPEVLLFIIPQYSCASFSLLYLLQHFPHHPASANTPATANSGMCDGQWYTRMFILHVRMYAWVYESIYLSSPRDFALCVFMTNYMTMRMITQTASHKYDKNICLCLASAARTSADAMLVAPPQSVGRWSTNFCLSSGVLRVTGGRCTSAFSLNVIMPTTVSGGSPSLMNDATACLINSSLLSSFTNKQKERLAPDSSKPATVLIEIVFCG